LHELGFKESTSVGELAFTTIMSTGAIIPSGNARTSTQIVIQAISTHCFAVMTYWGLGLILNRSRWQRQDIWLILLFLFCPLLMPCQLLSNIGCCIRNALRGAATSDGFAYYFSVALLFPLAQGLGTTIIYVHRMSMPGADGATLLGIDHRNGWMAFGGTLAAFVSLLVLLVGYDWKGDYSRDWRITIMGVQTYDTSNAFI